MAKPAKPAKTYCTQRLADGRPCGATPERGRTRCARHRFKVPGRPSKLTDEVSQRILDAVLEGAYLETAAQAAGVSPSTLHRWIRRGDDAEARALEHFDSTDEPELGELYEAMDPADWPYVDFRHALKSTEAFAELELLRTVRNRVGDRPWQAAMTVLERRHPSRWGRRMEVKHDGAVDLGKPQDVVPEEEARRAEILTTLREALGDDAILENTTHNDQENTE